MDPNEPVVDRRMRVFVMGDIKDIAEACEVSALRNPELCLDLLEYAERKWRNPVMSDAEHEAALRVAAAISPILEQAFLIKRDRRGGKVVHQLEPDDLSKLGWFKTVQPIAAEAWDLFQQRGWMNDEDR